MGRYLRQLKTGRIKIDKGKIKEEAHLDGKYIISTSDDTLSAEDVALGYKQLMEVERAFRTLKTTLDLRPVYHRKDERTRSMVPLFPGAPSGKGCREETNMPWDHIKAQMERLHLGEFFFKRRTGITDHRTDAGTSQYPKTTKDISTATHSAYPGDPKNVGKRQKFDNDL